MNAPASLVKDEVPISQGTDSSGNFYQAFASGASYYEYKDGSWYYNDPQGVEYKGNALGDWCDSLGNCVQAGSFWQELALKLGVSTSTLQGVGIFGGVILLALLLGGGKHRR
jgi:hypothetical protein